LKINNKAMGDVHVETSRYRLRNSLRADIDHDGECDVSLNRAGSQLRYDNYAVRPCS
jgi:hypothetical protein